MIYSPSRACTIIAATAVLHNMRRDLKLTEDEEMLIVDDVEEVLARGERVPENDISREGLRVREEIVQGFFTN
jgi:hypothetical protein